VRNILASDPLGIISMPATLQRLIPTFLEVEVEKGLEGFIVASRSLLGA